jgi:hypothetical protein
MRALLKKIDIELLAAGKHQQQGNISSRETSAAGKHQPTAVSFNPIRAFVNGPLNHLL